MSARAAARLVSLGFSQVYRYKAGKKDWLANGWPAEGTEVSSPHAGNLAHKQVPTCHLEDKIGEVRRQVQATGWDSCVVVNDEQVVLGLLQGNALQANPQASAESVMENGPRTYRLDASVDKMAEYMQKNQIDKLLVTDVDGRLAGIVFQKDIEISRIKGQK